MTRGIIVSAIVTVAAAAGLTAVFVQGASPYVTIKQAGTQASQDLHVMGKITPGTLDEDPMGKSTRFKLTDGVDSMPVLYTGPAVSNLSHAQQVVVIGRREGQVFHAQRMLLKCPSKYESTKATPGA